MKKQIFQTILILSALLLASAPSVDADATRAPASAKYTPAGDVVMGEMENVRFLRGEQTFGRIHLKPYDDPELEITVGPADRPRGRTVSWWEAQAYDGSGTGVWMASSSDGFPGCISLYVDSTTRAMITTQGLKLHESDLLFNDKDHYLARCGDDLCWHSPSGVINLTADD